MSRFVYLVSFGPQNDAEPVRVYDTLDGALAYAEATWGIRPTHTVGTWWEASLPERNSTVEVRRFLLRGAR